MSELPKIVRDRLAQAPAGPHPDPDQLTAFAEHALAARERSLVLAHLGVCAECREVVALAAPPQSAVEPAFPAARPWYAWNYMRWSGAVAAMLLVASIALIFQERWRDPQFGPAPAEQVKGARVESADPKSKFEDQARAATDGETDMDARKQARADVPAASRPAAPPPPAVNAYKVGQVQAGAIGSGRGAATGPPARDELAAAAPQKPQELKKEKDQKFDSLVLNAPAKSAERPRVNEVVDVQGEAPMVEATSSQVAGSGEKRSEESAKLARQAPPPAAADSRNRLTFAGALPDWRVSGAGALERRTDNRWSTALSVPGVRFTAVAVLGNNVWAGGSGGVVYVSSDNGRRWVRRQLTINGNPLQEDVLAISIDDAARATVHTASGSYTTADAGATWTAWRAEPPQD